MGNQTSKESDLLRQGVSASLRRSSCPAVDKTSDKHLVCKTMVGVAKAGVKDLIEKGVEKVVKNVLLQDLPKHSPDTASQLIGAIKNSPLPDSAKQEIQDDSVVMRQTAEDSSSKIEVKNENLLNTENNVCKEATLKQNEPPSKAVSVQVRKPCFQLPVLFKQLKDEKKILHRLFKNLKSHMSCSSLEYFLYIFGHWLTDYQPSDNDYIDWIGRKCSLQWLIIRLYKQEGDKSVPRGTWVKVETIFLLDGKRIPPQTMKLETNHIPKEVKDNIDKIIEDSLHPSSQKQSKPKISASNVTDNQVQS